MDHKDDKKLPELDLRDSGRPEKSSAGSKELLSPLVLELDEKESEGLDTAKLIKNIKFYGFPIAIFIFFIFVVFFFIIQPVQDLGAKFSKIDELESSYENRGKTLDALEALTISQEVDSELITKIETLVPTNSTRVVEFSDRLRFIAEGSGLDVDTVNASENIQSEEENPFLNLTNAPLYLIEIPAQLTATGSLEQFKTFLSNLYRSSDFFVVSEMTISKSTLDELWKADFILIKYQFGGSARVPSDISTFIVGKPVQEVIDFVNRKFRSVDDAASQIDNLTVLEESSL